MLWLSLGDCLDNAQVLDMAMIRNGLVVALCASACGEVGGSSRIDAAIDTAAAPPDVAMPTVYKGAMAEVPPVTFGGAPYCTYTITLKQLEIELSILPSGQVTMGRVQDLNVEAVIPTTNPNCPADFEVIPAHIASYTLQAATPNPNGTTLTFKGGPLNKPPADLTVELSSVGTAFQAHLGFRRNDGNGPPFNWSVITTVSLSPELPD